MIVSSAASGIGRGVAERFSQEGANVVLSGIDAHKPPRSPRPCRKNARWRTAAM